MFTRVKLMSPDQVSVAGRLQAAWLRRTTALLVSASLLAVAAGCSSNRDRDDRARGFGDQSKDDTLRRTEPADPFDLGAGRKPTPDTMFALAKIMAAKDERTQSMSILRNIIAQYPHYLPAYNALAEMYLQIGQSDDAAATLEAGLERAPEDPVLLNNLGMVYFLRENYSEALPHFTKAVDVRPEDRLYRANKAAALGMLGRMREARAEYRMFLSARDAEENLEVLSRARRKNGSAARPIEPPPTSPEAMGAAPESAAPLAVSAPETAAPRTPAQP